MNKPVYIDVPDEYEYNWKLGKHPADIICLQENIKGLKSIRFKYNSLAKISKGDIYELIFQDPRYLTLYLLKNEFPLVKSTIVEKYESSITRLNTI